MGFAFTGHRQQRAVPFLPGERHADPRHVGQVEVLPEVLHAVEQLPVAALGEEFGSQRRIEGHGGERASRDGASLPGARLDREVLRVDRHGPAVSAVGRQVERERSGGERVPGRPAVEREDRLPGRRHPAAEPGPQTPEVGLHHEFQIGFRVFPEADLADVQLVGDQVAMPVEPGPEPLVGDRDARGRERLPHPDLVLLPHPETERGDLADRRHLPVEPGVERELPLRPVGEMDAFGRRLPVRTGHQVAVDLLGQEGHERRGEPREADQRVVERPVGVQLVRAAPRLPEPAPAAAEPPVGERFGEGGQRAGRVVGADLLEARGDLGGRLLEVGEDPAVERGALRDRPAPVGARVEPVDLRVDGEEGIDVPEFQRKLAGGGAHVRQRVALVGPGRGAGEEEPAEGVGAGLGERLLRRGVVAARLGLLPALGIGDVAEHQARPVGVGSVRGREAEPAAGVLVEEQRRDHQQRVEPAAGLVHGFDDVVGGKGLLEAVAVLVRESPLRERHRAGVEPAVDDLGDPAVHPGLARVRPGHLVHPGLVDLEVGVEVRPFRPGLLEGGEGVRVLRLDLGHRGGRLQPAGLVVDPDVQRGAPEPLPGERPVHVVAEEVAEAALLDVLGQPVHRAAVGQRVVLPGRGADEPGGAGVLDERVLVRTPAEGVLVADGLVVEQAAFLPQAADDRLVRFLDPLAFEPRDLGGEPPVRAHRAGQRDLSGVLVAGNRLPVEVVVHLAEGGGLVHESGALVEFHEVGGEDPPEGGDRTPAREAALQGVEPVPEVVEGRPVAAADEFLAGEGAADREGTAEAPGEVLPERGGDHQPARFAAFGRVLDLHVVGAGPDRGIQVRGEGPGGGGPDDERETRIVHQRQGHVHRGVVHLAVAEADLGGREGGAALRPPPHDLLPAVEESLAMEFGERPPDALHVGAPVGDVGVVEVHPVADAGGHLLPVADVAEDARHALLDERAHPVLLDAGAAVDAELLLDLDLHRQAVGVPAGDPLGVASPHGVEAGEDVLEDPGEDVPVVGTPVRGRRTVVPDPGLPAGAPPNALPEDVPLLPEGAGLVLDGGDLGDGAGGPEKGHGAFGKCRKSTGKRPRRKSVAVALPERLSRRSFRKSPASPTGVEPVFSP